MGDHLQQPLAQRPTPTAATHSFKYGGDALLQGCLAATPDQPLPPTRAFAEAARIKLDDARPEKHFQQVTGPPKRAVPGVVGVSVTLVLAATAVLTGSCAPRSSTGRSSIGLRGVVI
jgi:hypothetical protein